MEYLSKKEKKKIKSIINSFKNVKGIWGILFLIYASGINEDKDINCEYIWRYIELIFGFLIKKIVIKFNNRKNNFWLIIIIINILF